MYIKKKKKKNRRKQQYYNYYSQKNKRPHRSNKNIMLWKRKSKKESGKILGNKNNKKFQ